MNINDKIRKLSKELKELEKEMFDTQTGTIDERALDEIYQASANMMDTVSIVSTE